MSEQARIGKLKQERDNVQAGKVDEQLRIHSVLVKVQGSVRLRNTENFVWHAPADHVAPAPVYIGRNVPVVEGMPVLIGYKPGSNTLEVLYEDADKVLETNISLTNYLPKHGNTHQWGKGDLTYLHTEAFLPLLVYPNLTGLRINVVAGSYGFNGIEKKYAGTKNVSISAHQPAAGLKRFVGLYLDSANILQQIAGATISVESLTTPEPAWPTSIQRLAVVTINGDTSDIPFISVLNRKLLWGTSTGVVSGDAGAIGEVSNEFDVELSVLAEQLNDRKVVQVVETQTGAFATGSTQIPYDDSIPINTEGVEVMSLAITPTNASNKLQIDVNVFLASDTAARMMIAALFQDTTVNALAVGAGILESVVDQGNFVTFQHTLIAGTIAATTFKVRAGLDGSGIFTFNGESGVRRFGGILASTITITEYKI